MIFIVVKLDEVTISQNNYKIEKTSNCLGNYTLKHKREHDLGVLKLHLNQT